MNTHCLPWACHRGVASLQPAALRAPPPPRPPHPSPPLAFPFVGEQSWLPTAAPAALNACQGWVALLHERDCKIFMPEEKISRFWCFPFLISFSLGSDSQGQGRRKGFTASSGQRPELQDFPATT